MTVAARSGRFWDGKHLVDLTGTPTVRMARAGSQSFVLQGIPIAALRPDGRWLARLGGARLPNSTPNRLSVYSLDEPSSARCCPDPRVLPGSSRSLGVLSWLDDDHLAILQEVDRRSGVVELRSLDVATGATATLVQFPGDFYGPPGWTFAPDLLTAPSVEGREPPRPWDPRWVAAGVAGVLTAAALLIGARRRHRALG